MLEAIKGDMQAVKIRSDVIKKRLGRDWAYKSAMQKMDMQSKRCPYNYCNFKDGAAISNRKLFILNNKKEYCKI